MIKVDKTTRSAKVFAAECTIANPFLLCRVTAVYARLLQKPRVQFAESINQSLRLISDLETAPVDLTNLPALTEAQEERVAETAIVAVGTV